LKLLAFCCAEFPNEMEARMTLEEARRKARIIVDREGYAISLCKLNPYSPNQVVMRQHDPRDVGRWWFVEVIRPEEAKPCE
jgi:hypothetical protein